eukprot:5675558-Karenia_brevis.AAC.1
MGSSGGTDSDPKDGRSGLWSERDGGMLGQMSPFWGRTRIHVGDLTAVRNNEDALGGAGVE